MSHDSDDKLGSRSVICCLMSGLMSSWSPETQKSSSTFSVVANQLNNKRYCGLRDVTSMHLTRDWLSSVNAQNYDKSYIST